MSNSSDLTAHELHNLHDLGGIATPDGPIRHGRLFRSANPDGLTTRGWEQLVGVGIRTIVDLRNDYELVPSVRPESLTVVRRPIEDQSDDDFMAAWGHRLGSPEYYPEVTRLWPGLIAEAVAAVADAPEGAVLIHCMAGRDRTGMITAILLESIGVERDAIFDNYANSVTSINAWWRVHGGPQGSQTDAGLAEYLVAARKTLNAYLDDLAALVFLAKMGVTTAQLDRIRERLLDD